MIWLDFDDIWQKYSKGSRIEFACFSFHVCLLVIKLSSLKLHTENNACMLCASVSYPLKLHLTTSELWFGQEQEGILPELLSSSGIV